MRKSIGMKALTLMGFLSILLLLICFLNLSAFSKVGEINRGIDKVMEEFDQAAQTGDMQALETAKEDYAYIIERSDLRVSGTIAFDGILIALVLVLMVTNTFVVKFSIAGPAKKANANLAEIVQKIEENQLTALQRSLGILEKSV